MNKCNHSTNYYVEKDAPVVLNLDGSVKCVTYRCLKCSGAIYKEHSWDSNWREVTE